jgi:hypothetical protein
VTKKEVMEKAAFSDDQKLWMRPIGEMVYFGIPVLKFALTRAEYLDGKLS